MKKNFLIIGLLSMIAMTFAACSSEEDNSGKTNGGTATVNLPTLPFADMAQEIRFETSLAATSEPALGKARPKMNALDITEDGNVIFEIEISDEQKETTSQANTGKKTFVETPIKSFDGKKIILDKSLGQIIISEPTRANKMVIVSMSVKLDIPGYGIAIFEVGEDAPIDVIVADNPIIKTTASTNLCRKWIVLGSIIDLEGDVTVYKEFQGCNLKEICDEAIKHGATMTDDERAQFNKTISSVTVSKAGLFTLTYSDGSIDAANWKWADNNQLAFIIQLKDEEMGNKFFDNDTKVEVAFKDNRCNLKCSTKITGDKNYNVVLTLQLKAAQ